MKYWMKDCKNLTSKRRYFRNLLGLLNSRGEP